MAVPRIAPQEPIVLGLDWIDSKRGWAYCQLGAKSSFLQLGCLPCEEAPAWSLVREALCTIVDAPIGLSTSKETGCFDRPCDRGARRWLRGRAGTVFVPPVEGELREWQRRRAAGETQRQGHARGLLPAISSAEALRRTNPSILESHPELVFAALAGRPLPAQGKKTLLLGLLARASLLQEQGVPLQLDHLLQTGQVPTDNHLDAIAMALVARAWHRRGDDLGVIRCRDGAMQRLGSAEPRAPLMGLPETVRGEPDRPPMSPQDLVALASRFRATRRAP